MDLAAPLLLLVRLFALRRSVGLLLLNVNEMDQINGSIPSVDFKNHELTRLTAYDDEAACHRLVDLHNASDVILAALEIDLAHGLVPILSTTIDAGQILVYDSLTTSEAFPHSDVAMGMACDDEAIDLEDAVDRMVLVEEGNVPVVQGELDRLEEVNSVALIALLILSFLILAVLRLLRLGITLLQEALVIDHRIVAAILVSLCLRYRPNRDDDVLILVQQLLSAEKLWSTIDLLVVLSIPIDITDLWVRAVLDRESILCQELEILVLHYLLGSLLARLLVLLARAAWGDRFRVFHYATTEARGIEVNGVFCGVI